MRNVNQGVPVGFIYESQSERFRHARALSTHWQVPSLGDIDALRHQPAIMISQHAYLLFSTNRYKIEEFDNFCFMAWSLNITLILFPFLHFYALFPVSIITIMSLYEVFIEFHYIVNPCNGILTDIYPVPLQPMAIEKIFLQTVEGTSTTGIRIAAIFYVIT